MRELNTGNVLPFYPVGFKSNDVHKQPITHYVAGTPNLLPFQIILPSSSNGGGYEFTNYDQNGNVYNNLATVEVPLDNGFSVYTYTATLNQTLINCNFYRVLITDVNGDTWGESEWIQSREYPKWDYLVFFTSNKDIGKVFYQDAYTQQLYFDGYEEAPLVDSVRKTEIMLDGRERLTSSRQVARRVIVGHNFVRSQMAAIKGIEQCTSVVLFQNGEFQSVPMENLVVTINNTEDDLFDAQFVFDVNIAAKTGCGENVFVKL